MCGYNCKENPRIAMDYTIVDIYGNSAHVCKEVEIFEEFDEEGLEEFCDTFRLLLVQAGFSFLENKQIKFIDRD